MRDFRKTAQVNLALAFISVCYVSVCLHYESIVYGDPDNTRYKENNYIRKTLFLYGSKHLAIKKTYKKTEQQIYRPYLFSKQ